MNFWEDIYRVEEDGKVFRKKGYQCNIEREIKSHLQRGYLVVDLSINGKVKKMSNHRLVALTYIPNPDNKPHVDHIDRNRLNNHFSNLRWVTHVENMQNTKLGKSGQKNIYFPNGYPQIDFRRNNLRYSVSFYKNTPLDDVIKQRDLMLSMF